MTPLEMVTIVFACVFGSAMLGLGVGYVLPEPHLSQASKDVVRLGTALVATMAALVLSLLISSAKSTYDRVTGELVENAARTISLDRILADYGPETKEARELLRRAYAARIELLFPQDERLGEHEDAPALILRTENLQTKLWQLSPQTDAQRGLRAQALELTGEMSATRWLAFLQKDEGLPITLLVILVFWLAIIFATFGLYGPRNLTVVATLFVCALSVSGAILIILEMSNPFSGLMKVDSAPMRDALANLGL